MPSAECSARKAAEEAARPVWIESWADVDSPRIRGKILAGAEIRLGYDMKYVGVDAIRRYAGVVEAKRAATKPAAISALRALCAKHGLACGAQSIATPHIIECGGICVDEHGLIGDDREGREYHLTPAQAEGLLIREAAAQKREAARPTVLQLAAWRESLPVEIKGLKLGPDYTSGLGYYCDEWGNALMILRFPNTSADQAEEWGEEE